MITCSVMEGDVIINRSCHRIRAHSLLGHPCLIVLEFVDDFIPVFCDGQVCLTSPKLLELVELFPLKKVQIKRDNVPELGDNLLRKVVIVSSVVVLEWNSVQEILGVAANEMKRLSSNDISMVLTKVHNDKKKNSE